jgi:hypothetical protein
MPLKLRGREKYPQLYAQCRPAPPRSFFDPPERIGWPHRLRLARHCHQDRHDRFD